uniref:Methyltransferase domain-containing protein n=1 Tax=Stomoxys calcitrans TaxID=35570 RepID=A0A1I8NYH4_STOCA
MEMPDLYHKSHHEVKRDSGLYLQAYYSKMKWHIDGGENFCEIGAGPGDVSFNYVFPSIPANYGKIVFSDISKDMLDFFKSNYKLPSKCEFKVMDIAAKQGVPTELEGLFDHVISMLVMHWVSDTRMALKNMLSLLRPQGGDCFMTFFSFNNIFAANYHMAKVDQKWSPFIKNEECFVSSFHFSQDPQAEFTEMMMEAGYSHISVSVKPVAYHYGDRYQFIENIRPVCGILSYIPKAMQSEFMDDYIDVMAKLGAQHRGLKETDCENMMIADLIVASGNKLGTISN